MLLRTSLSGLPDQSHKALSLIEVWIGWMELLIGSYRSANKKDDPPKSPNLSWDYLSGILLPISSSLTAEPSLLGSTGP
jgi:hypothetical protein